MKSLEDFASELTVRSSVVLANTEEDCRFHQLVLEILRAAIDEAFDLGRRKGLEQIAAHMDDWAADGMGDCPDLSRGFAQLARDMKDDSYGR